MERPDVGVPGWAEYQADDEFHYPWDEDPWEEVPAEALRNDPGSEPGDAPGEHPIPEPDEYRADPVPEPVTENWFLRLTVI